MADAELGQAIKKPTQILAKHVGDAIAHEEKAKASRAKAQAEFEENIAYYYEVKQRLLNPGYRNDLNGGKDRTPIENEKNFGAPDWATFNKNCAAYSLQHADRKLKRFAKANGLLTDGGENIDDPEEGRIDEAETDGASSEHRPQGRRKEDATAQRRYEFIALAAMDIANKNPEGEAEKQILAAAEHVPAPLMPLPPDIFTEVLSFITQISSSDKDDNIRAEAKKLLNKMLLHKPALDPAKVLEEATKEEKRKRDKRLAKKNGRALGSASYNPPTNGTSEDVQKSEPSPDRDTESSANRETAAVTLTSSVAQSPAEAGKEIYSPLSTVRRFWYLRGRLRNLSSEAFDDRRRVGRNRCRKTTSPACNQRRRSSQCVKEGTGRTGEVAIQNGARLRLVVFRSASETKLAIQGGNDRWNRTSSRKLSRLIWQGYANTSRQSWMRLTAHQRKCWTPIHRTCGCGFKRPLKRWRLRLTLCACGCLARLAPKSLLSLA